MPLFFDVHDDGDRHDLGSMRSEAIRAAGEMPRDMGGALGPGDWRMDVADEAGRTVLTLRFTAIEHGGR